MTVKLYNTLTRKKETLKPTKDKHINLFVCGITPYDHTHIGHAKTYVQFDIIVKYLRYRGYNVLYLQNITDIDDKIIQRAKERKVKPLELARKFEEEYHKDMKSLGIDSVSKFARATDHIKEIIKQVKTLMDKGFAYKIENDGIYFNLNKFPEYGKLSGRKTIDAEDAVTRIDDSKKKLNKGDFCLWKKSKENEPFWPDPWFNGGRPGWHIEDTAISEKYLGQQYDIHGGARDLIFPHHEAEIAQMESASGKKPFVRYWLHTGFLNVKGHKMAKSLGNFITIKDALKKYGPKVLRFFYLAAHYKSPIDFSDELLEQTKNSLERLNDFVRKLKDSKEKDNDKLIKKTKNEFLKCMDDDFDTPKALAAIFDFVKEVNKKGGSKKSYDLMLEFNKIFNVLETKQEKIPAGIKELTKEREKARKEKNYEKADKIRTQIKNKGYTLEDTEEGSRIKKI
ncbi:cysteine--tRNA ligase [Candidatus Woesearchaeota archaeon]|nr:cysteine--tRNA ligase [Candidatus Woesearchaeota archaeon]|tara:strand:- start:1664 stop:3022 length:1359 start_codon:yes stop_codon:yes gene_type:complete